MSGAYAIARDTAALAVVILFCTWVGIMAGVVG